MSRNHSEACRSRMEGILEDSVEGKMRKDKAAARREEQLTQELERQDKIITNAKPEESILIDEMQDDNGDKKGSEVGQSDAEDLQDGPMFDNNSRVFVADGDRVPNKESIVLRDGVGSSSDTRYALLLRVPAQVPGRSPDSVKNSPDPKKTRATTSARQDVEDRHERVHDNDDNVDDEST